MTTREQLESKTKAAEHRPRTTAEHETSPHEPCADYGLNTFPQPCNYLQWISILKQYVRALVPACLVR